MGANAPYITHYMAASRYTELSRAVHIPGKQGRKEGRKLVCQLGVF